MRELTIALAKGRLLDESLNLLKNAGLSVPAEAIFSRRLSIEDESGVYRFILVKPADVVVYVEHGIADCGIVGKDILTESETDLLQPLDLRIGACRIIVASADPHTMSENLGMLRVATKYPRITARHFGSRGVPVEIIQLSGSVELAPTLGLSDCIVDLAQTGRTLAENGLNVVEVIAESSARLVVNRASYQLKDAAIAKLITALKLTIGGGQTG